MNIIFFIVISLCLIVTSYYTIKYFKLKNMINSPIRNGYCDYSMTYGNKNDNDDVINFTSRIYVKELDRYNNDTSKIQISKIEYGVSNEKIQHKKIQTYFNDRFSEIQKTQDIVWLESVNEIKLLRKQKLDKIIKRKFFNIF